MELFRAKFDLNIVPNKKKSSEFCDNKLMLNIMLFCSETDVKNSEVTQPAKEGTL